MAYYALAYYKFVPIEDPHLTVEKHKEFFKGRDMTCRIYIGYDGINGQTSGKKEDAIEYIDWLRSHPCFTDIDCKIHLVDHNIYPRVSIKFRKEIVALGVPVDYSQQAEHLSPSQWRAMLEDPSDKILIDVRNAYETAIGHFENSLLPPLNTFREFPAYLEEITQNLDKDTPIMMCCTGGIRCEAFSPLFKAKGFTKVYQLQGGIIRYGLEEGSAHWKGKLFVFDDRVAIPIDGSDPQPIARCHHCGTPCDTYYNCAQCSCNELFLCCPTCLPQHQGCCSTTCMQKEGVRPYSMSNHPFRRLVKCGDAQRAPASSCKSQKSKTCDPA